MKCEMLCSLLGLLSAKPGRHACLWGLRQGDPISPYLFILCTVVLSRLLIKKVDVGDIQGLKLTRGGPRLHHLLFADDIFLFGRTCEREARHFKECLDLFYSWLGLSFNSTKSNIFFSACRG
ncbi:hypothetical protein UlMin_008295 [Ulmus minor]